MVTTSKAFVVGQTITGTGIDPGTKITAVAAGSITLSIAANGSATGAGTALTVAADAGNVSGDEQQTVTLGANTTGGIFRLTYTTPNPSNTTATTADIAWNAPATGAGSVQEALENLANVGVGNVSVTGAGGAGGVYTITFQGARFADTNVTQMTSTATGLTVSSGSKTATVATTREGGALERCTSIAAGACKAGTAGVPAGQFSGANPTRIAFDNLGNVYARGRRQQPRPQIRPDPGLRLGLRRRHLRRLYHPGAREPDLHPGRHPPRLLGQQKRRLPGGAPDPRARPHRRQRQRHQPGRFALWTTSAASPPTPPAATSMRRPPPRRARAESSSSARRSPTPPWR